MCIDCVIQSMCTGKSGHRETYCPTRHHTPLVTALLGLSVLDEIQKIIVTAYSLSATQCDEWTYDFEFERRINNTMQRVDLVITVRHLDDPVWYILGINVLCAVGAGCMCRVFSGVWCAVAKTALTHLNKCTVENEMSDRYKTLDVQRTMRWKDHFANNNLLQNDTVLWTGVMFNNPKVEPQGSKLLCLLSPQMKRSFLLDHEQLVGALRDDQMKERVFSYGLQYKRTGLYVVDQIDWKRVRPRVAGNKNMSTRVMLEVYYTGCGGLSWIRQRINMLKNVNQVPHIQLWNQQYGMCVYCDCLLYPPTGAGVSIMSNHHIGRNRISAEKTHARYARKNFNCAMGVCVPSILDNNQAHNLVCHECQKINTKLGFFNITVTVPGKSVGLRNTPITGSSDLLRRTSALSNLTCVCSVFVTGATENTARVGHNEHSMRLCVYVTNITESVVVDTVLPFVDSPAVRGLMASISAHGLLLQSSRFAANTNPVAPQYSVESALTGGMPDISPCHPLVDIFSVLQTAVLAVPAESTTRETYAAWLYTTYSRMIDDSACPEKYFDMVLGNKAVLMVQDLQYTPMPVYSTVSRLLTQFPVAFFSVNDGRNIYRLVAVYNIVQKRAGWIEEFPYDNVARPWTDGVAPLWRLLPPPPGTGLPWQSYQTDYSNMVVGMEQPGLADTGHLFFCVFQLVYGMHTDGAQTPSIQSSQKARLDHIKHIALSIKVGNLYEGSDLVRTWCILLKLVGSMLFHRLSLRYDVKITQNIFLFLYWTSCIVDAGFEEDDNDRICKNKILNIPLASWRDNSIQVDRLLSVLTKYLAVVTGSRDIRGVFAAITPSHYTNSNTRGGVTRDLCVVEKIRGLVDYTGYTPSRNFLLFHYLCCVLEFDELAKYVYSVRNVSRDRECETDTEERIAQLPPCTPQPASQSAGLPKAQTQRIAPATSGTKNAAPRKTAGNNVASRDTDEDSDDDNDATHVPDPAIAKRRAPRNSQNAQSAAKHAARNAKTSCRNAQKVKFVAGEMVVVRVDHTEKQFQSARACLDCSVIGPFEIQSFFTLKFEMRARLMIPSALEINKSCSIASLRKFVPHGLLSAAATADTFIVREVLAIRKTSPKLPDPDQIVLVSWKDYALDEASWEPLGNIPIEFVRVFEARQDPIMPPINMAV